jgi:hypothetical protein
MVTYDFLTLRVLIDVASSFTFRFNQPLPTEATTCVHLLAMVHELA